MDERISEQKCFDDMMTYGMKGTSTRTKNILKRFYGKRVHRNAPDFLIEHAAFNGNNKKTLIGIDHFEVDHLHFRKKKSHQSGYKMGQDDINSFIEKHTNNIMTGSSLDDVYRDLSDLISKLSQRSLNKDYNQFIDSFNYGFDKHFKKIDDYKRNIRLDSTDDYNIEIGFLIETYVDFKDLVLSDNDNTSVDHLIMPMFNDIFLKLNDPCISKLDYVMFVIRDISSTDTNVIPLRIKHLKNDLNKQNIKVYEYIGVDVWKPYVPYNIVVDTSIDYLSKKDNIDFNINTSLDKHLSTKYMLTYLTLFLIYSFEKNKKTYVTNQSVLDMCFLLVLRNIDVELIKQRRHDLISSKNLKCLNSYKILKNLTF